MPFKKVRRKKIKTENTMANGTQGAGKKDNEDARSFWEKELYKLVLAAVVGFIVWVVQNEVNKKEKFLEVKISAIKNFTRTSTELLQFEDAKTIVFFENRIIADQMVDSIQKATGKVVNDLNEEDTKILNEKVKKK